MKNSNKLISCTLQAEDGFIALITVVLVAVSTLLIASTLIYLSTSESFLSFQAVESHEASQVGDSCVEEGLFRLKHDVAYAGENLAIGNGTCDVTVTGSGTTRTIVASSTIYTGIGNFTRRITASTTISTNTAKNATTTDITRWYE